MPQNCETDQSNPTASEPEAPATRTRSGRVSKAPTRYEPVEQVEDDYAPEDYDSDESDDQTDDSFEDSDEEDDEDDADDDGNLDGFVVPDKSESDSDSTEDGGESAVPDRKRGAPIKKRPTPVGKRMAGKGGAAAK